MRNNIIENKAQISIIIPTYNESQNILNILKSIGENIPKNILTQAIVVDDNSPDGTGKLVDDYLKNVKKIAGYTIDVIHRTTKNGLSSAILSGIQRASGDTIVVMDSDLSHPPQIIPKMIDALKQYQCDLVIASRYITGGKILGWNKKRQMISKTATIIAKKGLGVKIKDPMSGFFAFKKNIIAGLNFDAIGYKILLEILVKKRGIQIKEIPYTFEDRKFGSSKLGSGIIIDYIKSILKLYKYGKIAEKQEKRPSVKFFSKAARFFTVGTIGLGVNYLISLLFADGISNLWYIHATTIGIISSMTSNFLLNKIWTFNDSDFSLIKTLKQYGKFITFSSLGALLQLGLVFYLVDIQNISYPISLIGAVGFAAFGNFILNKKWTFKEKLWN
ncbi:glycosyltransferase [Nitrosopumilus adriaticus]|uniref:Dolichol-phosphate mannosyltransferase n=1 Tax=Nitrosopumilus adriaticus TaxID=1580092 RepID=A0A0D5BYT1_9ARCH|nr:glycosyltransferase family 2 protein [Nitrosopumilus adriaticus]AJW69704.1 Glycosyl transferase family protein [Nitrosopumilus adriaticus]